MFNQPKNKYNNRFNRDNNNMLLMSNQQQIDQHFIDHNAAAEIEKSSSRNDRGDYMDESETETPDTNMFINGDTDMTLRPVKATITPTTTI